MSKWIEIRERSWIAFDDSGTGGSVEIGRGWIPPGSAMHLRAHVARSLGEQVAAWPIHQPHQRAEDALHACTDSTVPDIERGQYVVEILGRRASDFADADLVSIGSRAIRHSTTLPAIISWDDVRVWASRLVGGQS